jgi:hypothetical protein
VQGSHAVALLQKAAAVFQAIFVPIALQILLGAKLVQIIIHFALSVMDVGRLIQEVQEILRTFAVSLANHLFATAQILLVLLAVIQI